VAQLELGHRRTCGWRVQVPIHSLPQEWLWCESWCSDASKTKAKTIDLCNNPKTKEPKLQAAVRCVPAARKDDLACVEGVLTVWHVCPRTGLFQNGKDWIWKHGH
jgi:hypothetical protein